MKKPSVSIFANDLASFTRALARQLGPDSPSHLTLMNMLARAAGYSNVQHLRAANAQATIPAPPAIVEPVLPKADTKLVERALMQFDDQGRLLQWPARRAVQTLALWGLWAALPAGPILTEAEVNARLMPLHLFGDPATLRRTMISCGMLTRQAGGIAYCRFEQAPPPEGKRVIQVVSQGRKLHARSLTA